MGPIILEDHCDQLMICSDGSIAKAPFHIYDRYYYYKTVNESKSQLARSLGRRPQKLILNRNEVELSFAKMRVVGRFVNARDVTSKMAKCYDSV